MEENTYCVYMHTLIQDGRKYIGITKFGKNINRRWQNGLGYKKNIYFWRAIQKYGWDAFKHDILFENLLEDQACLKEQALIKLFNTIDSNYGFNITTGGEHPKHSETTRLKMSNSSKNKIVLDKAELIQKYISEDLSLAQCANYFNCCRPTVIKNLKLYNIEKLPIQILYNDLYHQYIILGKTRNECADYFKCSDTTVSRFLKQYNIKKEHIIKHLVEETKSNLPYNKIIISKEQLYNVYIIQNKSIKETASYFGCSIPPIRRLLKEYNIKKSVKLMHAVNTKKNVKYVITKENLYEQYTILGKSRNELTTYFNCSKTTIDRLLKKYNIRKTSLQKENSII